MDKVWTWLPLCPVFTFAAGVLGRPEGSFLMKLLQVHGLALQHRSRLWPYLQPSLWRGIGLQAELQRARWARLHSAFRCVSPELAGGCRSLGELPAPQGS